MQAIVAFCGGFVLRVLEVTVASSLYLLIGFLTAGALRSLVGPARLRNFFGTGRWSGPIRAWAAAATLLPVCALGVLPVLRELRRAGVRRDAILTFALAAPMFNPISLLYGFSYLGPNLLTVLAAGTLFVSVAVGLILGPGESAPSPGISEEVPSTGSRRLLAGFIHAVREACGPIWIDIGIGILGAGLMAASLQPTWLAEGMNSGDVWAIPTLAAIAPATYVTPEKAMTMLPEILKFGQSTGAMFCLIVLGVGMTVGHLRFIGRAFGAGTAARWFLVAATLALAGSYAVDHFVPAVGVTNADNDHFEEFTNPLASNPSVTFGSELRILSRSVGRLHWSTLAALGGMILAGAACRMRRVDFDRFLDAPDSARVRKASKLNAELPRSLVASLATVGLAAILIVGTYAYFPSPQEIFTDMTIIKADLFGDLSANSKAASLHHLDLWERQAAR